MNDYVEMYAQQFNLTVTKTKNETVFYDKHEFVSYIDKHSPETFHYLYQDRWTACKTSDLALLIINNISAHG